MSGKVSEAARAAEHLIWDSMPLRHGNPTPESDWVKWREFCRVRIQTAIDAETHQLITEKGNASQRADAFQQVMETQGRTITTHAAEVAELVEALRDILAFEDEDSRRDARTDPSVARARAVAVVKGADLLSRYQAPGKG